MLYSERIKDLRDIKNVTQQDIAKILNISRGVYGEYETEYNILPLKHLNTLCNYFDVSLDYIFEFTDIKNYDNSRKEIDCKLSGERIKNFRKELKFSQTKFADILNSSYGTIAGYERGRYLIATPFLYMICKKYNISADYLLGKIDEPKYLS